MLRLPAAALIGLTALAAVSAAAAPSPSPSLDKILLPPPAGYVATPGYPYSGHMSAHDFAATWGQESAQAESQIVADGFVDGYGMIWTQKSTGRKLLAFVLAFAGGSGAMQWLASDKAENYRTRGFQHPITVDGIEHYYGVHVTQASPPGVLDGFEFVKGNDLLGVVYISSKNDVLALATARAMDQYVAAPESTIPESQWPENVRLNKPVGVADRGLGPAIVAGIAIVVLLLALGLFMAMRGASSRTDATPPWARR